MNAQEGEGQMPVQVVQAWGRKCTKFRRRLLEKTAGKHSAHRQQHASHAWHAATKCFARQGKMPLSRHKTAHATPSHKCLHHAKCPGTPLSNVLSLFLLLVSCLYMLCCYHTHTHMCLSQDIHREKEEDRMGDKNGRQQKERERERGI